jgi:hypothetical protein
MKRMRHAKKTVQAFSATLGCLAMGLAGCANTGTTQTTQPAPQPTSAMVQVCDSTPSGCAAGTAFSLATLRDLQISVSWSHVPTGTHTQTLEVLEPGGGLYQATTQAFAIDQDPDGPATTLETLPVSGTWMTERGRTGAWSLRISLDNVPYATQQVQLNP